MIVAITGHVRKQPNESHAEQYERILNLIEKELAAAQMVPMRIACGRKNGVDRAAILYAKKHDIPYDHFPVRFSVVARADALLVFDDGSQSTKDVIAQMSRDGKRVHRVPRREGGKE